MTSEVRSPYPICDEIQRSNAENGASAWQSMLAYRELARQLEQEVAALCAEPTPEQLQEFCDRVWDANEGDPVLELGRAQLRVIYNHAITVAGSAPTLRHKSNC